MQFVPRYMPQDIDRLVSEFPAANVLQTYNVPVIRGGRIIGLMPYVTPAAIDYFTGGPTHVAGMNFRNHSEAKRVKVTDGGRSLESDGIKVRLGYAQMGDDTTFEKVFKDGDSRVREARFYNPLSLDAVVGGEKPLLTGIYPWALLPNTDSSHFGVYFELQPGDFGPKTQTYTIVVGQSGVDSIDTSEMLFLEEVKLAVINHNFGAVKTGTYKVTVDWKELPMMIARINGYQPLWTTFDASHLGPVELVSAQPLTPLEIILDDPTRKFEAEAVNLQVDLADLSALTSMQSNPMRAYEPRSRFREGRVAEMGGKTSGDVWDNGDLTDGGKVPLFEMKMDVHSSGTPMRAEVRDLVYRPLSRGQSVRLATISPYLGMFELQFSRVHTPVSATVNTYEPDSAQRTRDAEPKAPAKSLFLAGGDFFSSTTTRSFGGGGDVYRGLSAGLLEGGRIRMGEATQKGHFDWLRPGPTFRFVLGNE